MSNFPVCTQAVAIQDPTNPKGALKPLVDGSITVGGAEYETVAASQSAQVLKGSGNGSIGDYLGHVTIVPSNATAGAVTILDGNVSISVWAGGNVTGLVPFPVEIGAKSVVGPWAVTTGANVTVIAVGQFS